MIKKIIIIFCFILLIYYVVDYNRYFIYNSDRTKVFTIWKRHNHHSYLIPGKYYSLFAPDSNYVLLKNQMIKVIFNTQQDSVSYILGLHSKKVTLRDNEIQVLNNFDSILHKYGYIVEIKPNGKRVYNINKDSLIEDLDYKLIDTKRIYGIKIFEKDDLR